MCKNTTPARDGTNFFLASASFQSGALFSFHWCPSVRESWPHSLHSHTLHRVAQPRWCQIGLEWLAFLRKEWPRRRVRYTRDGISIRGAWPLSTDHENWSWKLIEKWSWELIEKFGLGKFLSFSFHKVSISNWNFSQCCLWLVRITSQLLRGLNRRKLCQNLGTTALSVRKQAPQKTQPKPLSGRLVSKTTKRNG